MSESDAVTLPFPVVRFQPPFSPIPFLKRKQRDSVSLASPGSRLVGSAFRAVRVTPVVVVSVTPSGTTPEGCG